MRIAVLAVLLLAQGGFAVQPSTVESPAEAALNETLGALTNLVIHEKVERYSRIGSVCKRDTLDTTVEVIDGVERYSEVAQSGHVYKSIQEIKGLWSFGEIATLLRTTRDGLAGQTAVGAEAAILNFHFPARSRRWFVMADSRMCWLDFEGQVFFAPELRRVRRISWISSPLPVQTGIDRVIWTVDFQPIDVSGQTLTLPSTAIYQVTRIAKNAHADWNVTTFANYARYGSKVTLRFEP